MELTQLHGMFVSQMTGVFGDWYVAECPLRHKPAVQPRKTCPSRNPDPCRQKCFKAADKIYKDWSEIRRNLWRDAAAGTGKTGYTLWMTQCLKNWFGGYAAPDVPTAGGGYNTDDRVVGSRYFPPACLGKAFAWAAQGVVYAPVIVNDWTGNRTAWECHYQHDLTDVDGAEFPHVRVYLACPFNKATGRPGWSYHWQATRTIEHIFYGILDGPPEDWEARARVQVVYKKQINIADLEPDVPMRLPVEPEDPEIPTIDVLQKNHFPDVPNVIKNKITPGSTGVIHWNHVSRRARRGVASAALWIYIRVANLLTHRQMYGRVRVRGLYDPVDRVYRFDRKWKLGRVCPLKFIVTSRHHLEPRLLFEWTGDGCFHRQAAWKDKVYKWHQRPVDQAHYDPFDAL